MRWKLTRRKRDLICTFTASFQRANGVVKLIWISWTRSIHDYATIRSVCMCVARKTSLTSAIDYTCRNRSLNRQLHNSARPFRSCTRRTTVANIFKRYIVQDCLFNRRDALVQHNGRTLYTRPLHPFRLAFLFLSTARPFPQFWEMPVAKTVPEVT